MLNFHHRLSTTAVSTKLAILFNLLQALVDKLSIFAAGNQQFFLDSIIFVTTQLQQMKFNLLEADVPRRLSTNIIQKTLLFLINHVTHCAISNGVADPHP